MTSLICGIQNMTPMDMFTKQKQTPNGHFYKTETDSQAQRTDLWLPR